MFKFIKRGIAAVAALPGLVTSLVGRRGKLPVILIFGEKGSGKTSLMRHILANSGGLKIYAIVNDEIGIDQALIQEAAGDNPVVALPNGCVCHTLQGPYQETLRTVARERRHYDLVAIEVIGGGDPIPVIQDLLLDDAIRNQLEISLVVAIVNAMVYRGQRDVRPEQWDKPVLQADCVLVNHCDLASADEVAVLKGLIRSINPETTIHPTTQSAVALRDILGLGQSRAKRLEQAQVASDSHHRHHHTSFTTVQEKVSGTVDWDSFNRFLAGLMAMEGLERTKFLLSVQGRNKRIFIDGIGEMTFEPKEGELIGEKRVCLMSLDFRRQANIAPETLKASFRACLISG